ncbi:MAG: hypothetical protein KDA24_18020 [Deltaproteobacteria bacterium]|nr:hypothetical protein [Deltaproteobacteria bacterium]
MRRFVRAAVVVLVAILTFLVLDQWRGAVPADPPYTLRLEPASVQLIEITQGDHTLGLRREGSDAGWEIYRGAAGRVTAGRVGALFDAVQGLRLVEAAAEVETVRGDEAMRLGPHRVAVGFDRDRDIRLLHVALGDRLVRGRRAVRVKGQRTAFWSELLLEQDPLELARVEYWLDPTEPLLCVGDPAVLHVDDGTHRRTLVREPGAGPAKWWMDRVGSGRSLDVADRDMAEAVGWSLTAVPGGEVLPRPLSPMAEEALAAGGLTVEWISETGEEERVVVGSLPDGRAVAQTDRIVIAAPASWRNQILRLFDIESSGTAPGERGPAP